MRTTAIALIAALFALLVWLGRETARDPELLRYTVIALAADRFGAIAAHAWAAAGRRGAS